MANGSVVLLGCGDINLNHEPSEPYSALARATLATGDIRFVQCERLYSERGSLQVTGNQRSRQKPHRVSVYTECGFNVVSVASNHTMDWGEDALMDTVAVFNQHGIQAVGAGRNLEEARRPVIVEHNGVRVAFLAYCSILHEGYAARPARAGLAPLRAHTYYEAIEPSQPGLPPKVVTAPWQEDLARLVEDVAMTKKVAHVVIVSLHWGVHLIPRVIADYQPITAKAAFEAGADLILGHHPHVPKAIGVHGGKVCFYSLGNFITTTPRTDHDHRVNLYGLKIDPEYPDLCHGFMDCKRSLIAKAVLTREGVKKVSFLPVLIDKQLRPEVLRHEDPRFDEAVGYMEWASEEFDHKFAVEGDEVIITGS